MRTFFISLLFIIGFLFFESAILSNIYVLPVMPDFLLLFVIYLSIHKGGVQGETAGFISGILLDFLSAAPLGLNAMLRTITAYICSFFYCTLNTNGILIPFILGFLATILKSILTLVLSFFYPGVVCIYSIFNTQFWIEAIMNGILAPIVFYLFSKVESISIDSEAMVLSMEKKN